MYIQTLAFSDGWQWLYHIRIFPDLSQSLTSFCRCWHPGPMFSWRTDNLKNPFAAITIFQEEIWTPTFCNKLSMWKLCAFGNYRHNFCFLVYSLSTLWVTLLDLNSQRQEVVQCPSLSSNYPSTNPGKTQWHLASFISFPVYIIYWCWLK